MGHGAPKRISTIPISHVISIGAAEGLLYQANRNLQDSLRKILGGSDDPQDWVDLDAHRIKVSDYTRQYLNAIYQMNSSQQKG